MQIEADLKTKLVLLDMEEEIAKNRLEIVKIKKELLSKENTREYVDILEKRMKVLKNRNVKTGRNLREGRSVYA